jgi:hypothetical protein
MGGPGRSEPRWGAAGGDSAALRGSPSGAPAMHGTGILARKLNARPTRATGRGPFSPPGLNGVRIPNGAAGGRRATRGAPERAVGPQLFGKPLGFLGPPGPKPAPESSSSGGTPRIVSRVRLIS